jgi:hypothetical protein
MSANYRVDKPPSLLLTIQDQLNKAEVDIEKVCQLILREPSFCDYLQQTASKNSRQQLPVDTVKHAIMMHGLGRAQSILTQQALMLRLVQSTFPLMPIINQFTSLARAFSEHIAEQIPLFLPEEASTFVSFICSGLYTDVRFKRMVYNQHCDNQELRILVTPSKNPIFLERAKKLAKAWQQDTISLKAIDQMQKSPIKVKTTKRINTLMAIAELASVTFKPPQHILCIRHSFDLNLSDFYRLSTPFTLSFN